MTETLAIFFIFLCRQSSKNTVLNKSRFLLLILISSKRCHSEKLTTEFAVDVENSPIKPIKIDTRFAAVGSSEDATGKAVLVSFYLGTTWK